MEKNIHNAHTQRTHTQHLKKKFSQKYNNHNRKIGLQNSSYLRVQKWVRLMRHNLL